MNKILYIINRDSVSGPNKQLSYIIEESSKTFEVYLICLFSAKINTIKFPENVKRLNLKFNPLFPFITLIKFFYIIHIKKFSVIQSFGLLPDLLCYLSMHKFWISTARNCPSVDYTFKYGFLKGYFFSIIQYFTFKRCKYLISCSSSIDKHLQKLNICTSIINNGIKIVPTCLDSKKNHFVNNFITVGNLNKRKNLFYLINAFNNYVKVNDKATLVVIGDGPELINLQTLQSKNIKFIGNKSNVKKYLNSASVFVSSSLSEGLPNAVLEALDCQLLCFISKIEPHKSLKIDFPSSIQLFSLLDNGEELFNLFLNTQNFYDQLSTESFSNLKNYSCDIMSSYYISLYNKLISYQKL